MSHTEQFWRQKTANKRSKKRWYSNTNDSQRQDMQLLIKAGRLQPAQQSSLAVVLMSSLKAPYFVTGRPTLQPSISCNIVTNNLTGETNFTYYWPVKSLEALPSDRIEGARIVLSDGYSLCLSELFLEIISGAG